MDDGKVYELLPKNAKKKAGICLRIPAKTVTINNGTLGAFYCRARRHPACRGNVSPRLTDEEQGNAVL